MQHEGTLRPNGVWTTRSLPRCSLELAARLFDSISGKIIVEIGSGLQGPHAGESVKVWSTQTNAKAIYCLDLDRKCIEDVFRWAQSEGHSQVHPRVVDGLAFVGEFPGEIDLLYLDFWTEDPAGAPFGTGREEGYLRAFKVAEPKLAARSMILIDDTEKLGPWKHTKIVPAARQAGFEVLWTGRQTMLAKGILDL